MGILITTYKSLPEQVEANKEKCADLQEQINNIDTHEIEEIKQQVEDNTHDINSLTNGLSVTNGLVANHTQRLNGLDSQVGSLETKTTYISKVGNDTKFSTNVNVEGSINSVDGISTDGIISAGSDIISESVIKGQVLVAENDNGEGRFAIDNDGDMNLYNPANAGKLITTGNIEEYAPQTKTYLHIISFTAYLTTNGRVIVRFELTSSDNTPINTETRIIQKFLSTGGTYGDVIKPVGAMEIDTNGSTPTNILGNVLLLMYKNTSTQIGVCEPDGTKHTGIGSIKDTVIEL